MLEVNTVIHIRKFSSQNMWHIFLTDFMLSWSSAPSVQVYIHMYSIVMFSKIDPHIHTCPKWQVCAEAFSIKCHNREREGSKKINKSIMNKYYRVETWKNYINYVWFRGVNDTAEFLSICKYLREIVTVCILLHMNKGPRLVRLLEKRMSHSLWHCPFKWYRKSIMLLVGC